MNDVTIDPSACWGWEVTKVLTQAPFAYLAVETSRGPHITPLLFASAANRLWLGIGRDTLKGRILTRRPAVGIVVPHEDAAVVIRGRATFVDGVGAPSSELMRLPFGLAAFSATNALEMAAFARDAARRGTVPTPPTPVSVRADSLRLLRGWPADAVVGWNTPDGPLALPCEWNSETRRATVPADLLHAADAPPTAPACVCIDTSDGRGPLAKSGVLLRGSGTATFRGDRATISLDAERITRWDGFDTSTVETPEAEAEAS